MEYASILCYWLLGLFVGGFVGILITLSYKGLFWGGFIGSSLFGLVDWWRLIGSDEWRQWFNRNE